MAARQSTRLLAPLLRRRPVAVAAARKGLHNGPPRNEKPGHYARTDSDVEIEYPEEHELPPSKPVRGLPGQYVKPTLASFSLDGNVGLVTGGARGLGLVIAQGMVYSGADLALVDMNSASLFALASTTIRFNDWPALMLPQKTRPRSRPSS